MPIPRALAAAFRKVPANRLFGFRLVAAGPTEVVVRLPVRPAFRQEGGVVHGGILSALADTAAVYLVHPTLEPGQSMTSIEFKVNFLRPGRPGAGPIEARSRLLQRGRRVAVCEVELAQAGKLVAKGLFTYLILARLDS